MKDEAFNWLAILKDLVTGRPMTTDEKRTLKNKAMIWPDCACGQLCKDIPRSECGVPEDRILRSMGAEFAGAIGVDDWGRAIAIFHLIENRTAEVWEEIHGTGKN